MTRGNFISMIQVVEAAEKLGLIHEPEGWFHLEEVVGRMTGLDMTKYKLVEQPNFHGWELRRREIKSPCEA